MTISRRQALGWASAFAATFGTGGASLAAALKGAAKSPARGGRSQQTLQRFLEVLIHHDEAGKVPHVAEIAVSAPDTAWYAIDTLDALTYETVNRQNKKRGFRLKRVNAFKTSKGVRYAACWEQTSGADWHSRHGMNQAGFESANATFAKQGMRLAYVDARVHYAAIWEKGDASTQQVFARLTPTEYQQQYATLVGQGLRPTRISLSMTGGTPFIAAIFEKDDGSVAWQSFAMLSSSDFHKANATLKAQGYHLADASGHMLSGKATFAGVWEKA
jgi:hypothetical protein